MEVMGSGWYSMEVLDFVIILYFVIVIVIVMMGGIV